MVLDCVNKSSHFRWFGFANLFSDYWVHASSYEAAVMALYLTIPDEWEFELVDLGLCPEHLESIIESVYKTATFVRAENCFGAPDYIE